MLAAVAAFRQRAEKLAAVDLEGLPGVALVQRLADADDGDEAGGDGSFRLRLDDRVSLAMIGAALGVADDDVRAAEVLQHGSACVAGMRTLHLHVAVLAANGNARTGDGIQNQRDQGEGRADQYVVARRARPPSAVPRHPLPAPYHRRAGHSFSSFPRSACVAPFGVSPCWIARNGYGRAAAGAHEPRLL